MQRVRGEKNKARPSREGGSKKGRGGGGGRSAGIEVLSETGGRKRGQRVKFSRFEKDPTAQEDAFFDLA
eukprot:507422-Rhodomonas_salina.1